MSCFGFWVFVFFGFWCCLWCFLGALVLFGDVFWVLWRCFVESWGHRMVSKGPFAATRVLCFFFGFLRTLRRRGGILIGLTPESGVNSLGPTG